MKLVLNGKYAGMRHFVSRLPEKEWFATQGTTIHNGRNTLKIMDICGVETVVKKYGHITLFNRFVYGKLRKSKAVRAYTYAARLREAGIDTPEEIAIVETRRNGLLNDSFFVSVKSRHSSLGDALDSLSANEGKEELIKALSEFLFRVHEAGICHKDLHQGNILYERTEDGRWHFQLIDINQMAFCKHMSMRKRIVNLLGFTHKAKATEVPSLAELRDNDRFLSHFPLFTAIIANYAQLANVPARSLRRIGAEEIFRSLHHRHLKHAWKKVLHTLPTGSHKDVAATVADNRPIALECQE